MKESQIKQLGELLSGTEKLEKKIDSLINFFNKHLKKRSAEEILQFINSLPMNSYYRNEIINGRKLNYYDKSTGNEITDWKTFDVNLWDFIRYIPDEIKPIKPEDDWGFRIYPAYNGTSIYLLVGISNSNEVGSNVDKAKYFELYKNHGEGEFKYSNAKLKADVISGFQNYWDNVLLTPTKEQQNKIHSIKSRFFYLSEIISFIISTGLDFSKPEDLKKCKLQFEIGFVTEALNDQLSNLFIEPPKPHHVGFAALISLIIGETKSNLTLEVARPCPPRCGSMDFSSLSFSSDSDSVN